MEGSCSTGQSPQWAVVPVEEEEEDVNVAVAYFRTLSQRSFERDMKTFQITITGYSFQK
jgi:hypothetical protein